MRKVIKVTVLSFVLISMMVSSFSLFQIRGLYSSYAKGAGPSAGLDLPIIPFIPVALYVTKTDDVNITLPSFTYQGTSFSAGTVKANTLALELQLGIPFISIAGIETGFSVLADMLTAQQSVGGAFIALPGNVYGGVFGTYKQDLLPLVSWFAQLGYLVKIVDGEKTINTAISPAAVNLSAIDKSGLCWKVGVSIGL